MLLLLQDFVYERDDDGYNREKRDVDDIQSSGDEEIVVHDSDIIALKSSMADKSGKSIRVHYFFLKIIMFT